jgi:invasion protein IalB
MLFVNLPLNTDLKKKPIVVIDGKNLGNLTYSHCNSADGCKTNVRIEDDVIDLFKKGKTMTVFVGIYGASKGIKIEFPLKNFSKSYKKLIKE